MGIVLPPLLLVAVLLGVLGVRRVRQRPRKESRNDMLRAGQSQDDDPNAAARRAQGKVAWMRMSGF